MTTNYRAIMGMLCDGYSYSEIERSLGCSSKSVALARCVIDEHGLDAEAVEQLSDQVVAEWFPDKRRGRDDSLAVIDVDAVLHRLKQAKKPKIQVEYERYVRQCQRDGLRFYGQSQFYRIVSAEIDARDLSWPLEHFPGHTMMVDWSGDGIWVGAPGSPDSFQASVFVASLPFSGLLFAGAYVDKRTPRWIQAHVDALNYFGGSPQVVIPDNDASASFRPRKGDPEREICTPYRQWGDYYQLGIVPTRPGEPTHKAHVERSVGIAQDWINEYLRPTVFDCLDDLNDEIYQQIEWINKHKTPYRGFDGHTRFAEFEEYEKHALKALPDMAWEYREWKVCSVRPDCHFQIDRRRYSVPYTWAGSQVRVGLGDQSVAIYSLDGKEHIWTHPRNYGRPGSYVSEASHQAPETYVGGKLWTKDRYQTWAGRIGPATLKAVTIVLERVEIVSQGFYTCENIMRLTKRYSQVELEQACQYVLRSRQYVNYRNIHDALTMFTDRTGITAHDEPTSKTTRQASPTPKAQPEDDTPDIVFDNPHLRGINAFQLPQPSTPPTPQPGTTETGKKDK